MTEEQRLRLRAVKTFAQLISFLRDELDWPIDQGHDEEDLTFDWSDDLGLKDEERVGIKEIKQLRPLETGQPWGIFFVNFEKKNLPIVILRRILNALVLKKRASANRAQQAAWQQRDLLFISAYGQESERQLTFAHFSEPTNEFDPSTATLRVLGWDDDDTSLKLDYVADTLKAKLTWPTDTADLKDWRQRWSDAFELQHREVIDTAQDLALRLADLAKRIRNRMLQVLPRESETGELRKLLKGFQAALIHDLDEAQFADMYAQTITYGLFSAAVSRTVPGAGTAVHQGNVVDMVPVTNPFLREMLSSFLRAGGRRGKLDFDELGIQEVVDLLNDPNTHMDAVLRDFGNRTRGEDPVIHFYEEFLKAYDKKLKVQRGVFYTPQPVVSYIVRSVHELLQTEFDLADGLADTTTWGEMLKRHPGLKLPPLNDAPGEKRTISPDEPFVQILDPATGTATFLVEVIEVIFRTLKAKWKQQRLSDVQQAAAWNDYVPKHLLPRLHAYELMMAPYAIAHMKIGLKLSETGYRFGTVERARIYLTNALEPWLKQLPLVGFDALAHEAAAVNEIKRHKRFTVIVGNPPYSGHSANTGDWIHGTLRSHLSDGAPGYFEVDGAILEERNPKWLNDDYVKFIRFSQHTIADTGTGLLGFITNHGFLDNPTFRGMRQSLLHSFDNSFALDLHGNVKKAIAIELDQNVFDIQQGVAIGLWRRRPLPAVRSRIDRAELQGARDTKYGFLSSHSALNTACAELDPVSPFYLFVPQAADRRSEFSAGYGVDEMFSINAMGVTTGRDQLCVSFTQSEALAKMNNFTSNATEEDLATRYGLSNKSGWSIAKARSAVRANGVSAARCKRFGYRPMDERILYMDAAIVGRARLDVMKHMDNGKNLAMCTTRQVNGEFRHVFCTQVPTNDCLVSNASGERAYLFPLYLAANRGLIADSQFGTNLATRFVTHIVQRLGLQLPATQQLPRELTPEDIFRYMYAVFHSPGYRIRYAEFLKIEFPRLPLTWSLELFRALARLGGELVAVHLLESPCLAHPITEFIGGSHPVVEKISWSRDTVWVDKAQTIGFQGVHEPVWNFHIGGYQVCEKWLKDRKGRTLSKDDIAHYQNIVVGLSETIRLMAEIDRVIEAHGGWPGAFQATATA